MNSSASNQDKTGAIAPRGKAILLCILLILTGGVAHGYLDGRWTRLDIVKEQAETLQTLPVNIGNWRLVSETELEDSAKRILRCYGSTLREYANDITGDQITVFVVYGPRGPIAVHTPEVCYSSIGTEPAGERVSTPIMINGETQTLWKVKFRKPDANEPPHMEVCYGWSDGGPWKASSLPRVWLTDSLYKIQVAGPPAKSGEDTSPVEDFLREFLPALQRLQIGTQKPPPLKPA